jgi:hypothetical protein
MTEDQIRDLLREMRDEPIPPDTRVRVRAAVVERIQSGSWASIFHGPWRTVAVLLAMTSIVAVLLFMRPSRAVHEPSPGVAARQPDGRFEGATPPEKTMPAPVRLLHRAKHPARRMVQPAPHRQEAPAAGDGVLIRIETPDPDVVIVLVGD